MDIIIAGSRDFDDYGRLCQECDTLLAGLRVDSILCGECRGADALGKRYAEDRGISVKSYPADWQRYGRAAGPIRNKQMAEAADLLIAFWDGQSRGTHSMIKLMQGKAVEIVYIGHEPRRATHGASDQRVRYARSV